jgi:hypothetical protein
MDDYIRNRLIADARRIRELAEQQSALENNGLKGRFRELLIDGMLDPWLPPTVQCATGTVVSSKNYFRNQTQEDVLLIDRSISPSVLAKRSAQEGVFTRNSVLARIEVKSTLEKADIEQFRESCRQFQNVQLDLTDEQLHYHKKNDINYSTINFLFAFKSSASAETTFNWFRDSNKDGSISAVCVADRGYWMIVPGDTPTQFNWVEYQCLTTTDPAAERIAAFTGVTSNTAFDQHLRANGRDPLASLNGGVGKHFQSWNPAS